jgi:hypothetical protein
MRSLFRLLLLSCSLSLPLPTAAAEPLTFAQTLAVAAEKNPSLAAQAYQERAAGALIDQASVRPIPTLDVTLENALGTGRLQGVRSLETTVQASQVFERGDKLAKRPDTDAVATGQIQRLVTDVVFSKKQHATRSVVDI